MPHKTGQKEHGRAQRPKLHDVNKSRGRIIFLDPERGGENGSKK